MYKLNTASKAAKFYEWIWETDITKFKTMCPYFWKYVLTILFIIPILIGKLIVYLIPAKKNLVKGFEYISETKVGKKTGNVVESIVKEYKFWHYIGQIFKWIFFIAIGCLLITLVVALGFEFYASPIKFLAVIGGITIFTGLISIIFYITDKYNILRKIGYPFRLFGNMIYSLYKNVCPIIIWN